MAAGYDSVENLRMIYPGLPDELLVVIQEAYVETGDSVLAYKTMQADPAYDRYFPGNRREDGSLRMTEGEYSSYQEYYNATLRSYGINPEAMPGGFPALVEGEVSPLEFDQRVSAAYDQVIDAAPELKAWYAEQYGLALTDEALMAAYLDPSVGEAVLAGRISVAELAAQGEMRGFDISFDLATRLEQLGYSPEQAAQSFSSAVELVPTLNALARRHNDPDDDFDINEFAAATMLDDPFERRRFRRLLQQEAVAYRSGTMARSRDGLVSGLRAR